MNPKGSKNRDMSALTLGTTLSDLNAALDDPYQRQMQELGGRLGSKAVLYVDSQDHDSLDHRGEFMVCDVCKVPLNRLTATDGSEEEWLHSRNWQEYDHEPVPVAAERRDVVNQLCDFCGVETQLYYMFSGKRIRLGSGNTLQDYGHNWSACQACSPLVEEADYEGLSRRIQRTSPTMQEVTDPEQRRSMLEAYLYLWQAFIPTITGMEYIGPSHEPIKLNPRLMPKLQLGLLKFWAHPGLRELAREMMQPHEASIPGVHHGDEDTFIVPKPAGQEMNFSAWRSHWQHLRAGVGTADMYWISSNFTNLAIHAGKRFEKLVITREEMPSSFGFMVFAEPIGVFSRPSSVTKVRAVTWSLVPGGVWFNLYVQSDDGPVAPEEVLAIREQYGYLVCPNGGTGLAFGEEIAPPAPGEENYLTTILATWVLINQPGVAGIEQAPVDKKYARSYQREHHRQLPPVKLVELRKRPRPAKPKGEATGREWTERRYVKGHMKRQFYGAGRAFRKWIYVDDYIAGPDGAPLREPRREVRVLR